MSEFWMVSNEFQRDRCRDHVGGLDLSQKWRVKVEPYQPTRSFDQNSIINAMYGDIANQSDHEGVVDVRRRCKLHFGVPILRAHDADFRAVYDKIVRPHDYEDKLKIMDFLPVTSRMKKPQATEYIETVMREHVQKGFVFKEVAYV